jgi:hypothetical protein
MDGTVRSDLSAIAWWLLVGTAAGAAAGFVVGGVGGRLAMLLLRLTSPDDVLGLTSDDGFEIGVVSADTVQLLLAMAMLGGINGVLYAAVRAALPERMRLPLWVALAVTLGGATIVHEDGVDFTLLEPAALAIALFVVLPGVAAALVVVLVERWIGRAPWGNRRLTVGVCLAALAGTFALGVAAIVGAAALAVRRAGLGDSARTLGRVAVPLGLVAVTLVSGWQLVAESIRILD